MEKFRVTEELLASQGQRFLNFILDYIIRLGLLFCLSFIIALIFVFFGFDGILDFFENLDKFEEIILGLISILVYYVIMETFFSRTIAKYITGTIVVMKDGSKPNFEVILKRTLCRIIPFDGLSFFGTPSRGWHDTMSNTYVVRKTDFEAKITLFYEFDEIGKKPEPPID